MGLKESGIQDKNLLEPPWFYPEENSMEENKEKEKGWNKQTSGELIHKWKVFYLRLISSHSGFEKVSLPKNSTTKF